MRVLLCALLCLTACRQGGEQEWGEYWGDLRKARLDPAITLKDPDDSWIVVTFSGDEREGELWADIQLVAGVLVYGHEINEDATEPTRVQLEGHALECKLKAWILTFNVTGRFSPDWEGLSLNVEQIGRIPLKLFHDEDDTAATEEE